MFKKAPLLKGATLRVTGCPSSVFFAKGEKPTCTLAVPKIFFGIRLEYFDRGAKSCSLHRPQDALHRLCSKGRLKERLRPV